MTFGGSGVDTRVWAQRADDNDAHCTYGSEQAEGEKRRTPDPAKFAAAFVSGKLRYRDSTGSVSIRFFVQQKISLATCARELACPPRVSDERLLRFRWVARVAGISESLRLLLHCTLCARL